MPLSTIQEEEAKPENFDKGFGYFGKKYSPKKLIGSGAFGQVMQAVSKNDGTLVAVKQMTAINEAKTPIVYAVAKKEVRLMRKCKSDHVIEVLDYIEDSHALTCYIALELADETLKKFLECNRVDTAQVCYIFEQVAMGLGYIHKENIVHRDIKLDNLLVTRDSEGELLVKICDFGLAAEMTAEGLHSLCGSPRYMAPEMVPSLLAGNRQVYRYGVDIWSVGVCLFWTVVGYYPFIDDTKRMGMERVWKNVRAFDITVPLVVPVPPEMMVANLPAFIVLATEVMRFTLCPDPDGRFTAFELVKKLNELKVAPTPSASDVV